MATKFNITYILKELFIWAVSLYLAYLFIVQGWYKFDPEGFWAPAFKRWGYGTWFLFLIGFLECLGAILIVIPRTATYGGTIVAVVMAGALATRGYHGASTIDLAWIAAFMLGGALVAWLRKKDRWQVERKWIG